MGLFLQKTNIIRDYREDLDDKRKFWPKEVWSKYANDLSDFADPKNLDQVFPSKNYLNLGPKLHLRNDINFNRSCNRLSNLPLCPPRPIRLQFLCDTPSHGNRNTSPRIPKPPRLPTQHQTPSRRDRLGIPSP
jgi:hypothetical protein